ncbi:glycosyltransferase [Aequorivita sublithincola DSM 14238]|uniref:Glycosyltransferase n=1 Tax=Aequorivita sublithincola (strain DSM 14238 / LMG 21431 / ACAM 643 / 9-3) TaxID=746697 RepID=I3YZD7_AEQSU|nr:glycosyltransferase family 4 protein [Aequorivita sublithincola]AFL82355.1 glycosyltransferase [Aequorivita sublithincola DSM 14238]
MKIIYFTKYTRKGASSRLRSYQYFPFLEEAGFSVSVFPLFSDKYLNQLYNGKVSKITILNCYFKRLINLYKISKKTKVVIEKELFPYLPAWAEQFLSFLGINYVVDYDDAIFHNYDKNRNSFIRFLLKNKIDVVMRNSKCVMAGNSYLKSRADEAGAKRVYIIPTVIDLNRYTVQEKDISNTNFVIGWIGSPSTFKYVQEIAPVLKELALNGASIHIVGANGDLGFTKNVTFISWNEESEVNNISNFDVGIMPLEDTPWEKGKCAYKLIQYMACGLPVVASPIGMNNEVVHSGENGFLASTNLEWSEALNKYKNNPDLRRRNGKFGKAIVEEGYTVKSRIDSLLEIIKK